MTGILCGLRDEEIIALQVEGARVVCSGARPDEARALVNRLKNEGITRLMSFGVAGALDPELPVGAVVVGRRVVSEKGAWDCDASWAADLMRQVPGARFGDVWGSETLVPTAVEKLALFESSECIAVDMESQCAAELGMPVAVVRVVCDTAQHNLPPSLMKMINPDGKTNIPKAALIAATRPWEIPDLVKTQLSMQKALKALDRSARRLNFS